MFWSLVSVIDLRLRFARRLAEKGRGSDRAAGKQALGVCG
jgi:hypothetical protein